MYLCVYVLSLCVRPVYPTCDLRTVHCCHFHNVVTLISFNRGTTFTAQTHTMLQQGKVYLEYIFMSSCIQEILDYCVRDVDFCLPTGLKRDCSKRRRHAILVSLKKSADLGKDLMEMFLRYSTYFAPLYKSLF